MKTRNVLVGSCGGLTGIYITKYLRRKHPEYQVYGFDMNDNIYTKFILDDFFIVPGANDPLFSSAILDIIKEKEIDVYIPTHSKEVRVISQNYDMFSDKAVVSPIETIKVLEDKKLSNASLRAIGIDVPNMVTMDCDSVTFPLFSKKVIGSGSSDVLKITSHDELRTELEKGKLVAEFLSGDEYTVDCFFNKSGELVTYNQRVREKTMGGAAIVCRNDHTVDFSYIIKQIAGNYKIYGPANFQFFYLKDNRKVLTDINLRFASGGLPLSVESGADSVELTILEALNEKYDTNKYQSDKKPRVMYRHFEEGYEIL